MPGALARAYFAVTVLVAGTVAVLLPAERGLGIGRDRTLYSTSPALLAACS